MVLACDSCTHRHREVQTPPKSILPLVFSLPFPSSLPLRSFCRRKWCERCNQRPHGLDLEVSPSCNGRRGRISHAYAKRSSFSFLFGTSCFAKKKVRRCNAVELMRHRSRQKVIRKAFLSHIARCASRPQKRYWRHACFFSLALSKTTPTRCPRQPSPSTPLHGSAEKVVPVVDAGRLHLFPTPPPRTPTEDPSLHTPSQDIPTQHVLPCQALASAPKCDAPVGHDRPPPRHGCPASGLRDGRCAGEEGAGRTNCKGECQRRGWCAGAPGRLDGPEHHPALHRSGHLGCQPSNGG